MAETWLKSTVEFELSGEGHLLPRKRNFANVANGATDAQVLQFGRALATLSDDTVTGAAVTVKQAVEAN
ncbi:DUF1659 domain-containing protein [Furfurilactobacillus siliginis]|uniref:DUF1659 domain-containing protein n=1 Tax=Furfurilactobacillus siliginis TaxID=348151 RepID=A0A0R2KZT4_9LACO|nr:hypothetical protein [Furfurilactobacillus siliginis]KRN94894.1 hypothetical protein IV55_GL000437 [Furfurilactobacillus siliginis]GEK28470.1 hypothetical protein LSI01_07810 [Furfurilactobacillus siliginis]